MRIPLVFRNGRVALTGVLMAAAVAASSACNLHLGTGVEVTDSWTRTYTVKPGATLDVRETNGRVHVEAIEGNTVEVAATRIARAPTEEGAKALLKDIKIAETATADRVELDSTTHGFDMSRGRSRSVNFHIKVPRSMDVTIKTTNGEVDVRGIAGFLRVEAVNGEISGSGLEAGAEVTATNGAVRLEFAQVGDAGVRCKTTNGLIVVSVPAKAKATIAARVTNGGIETENLQLQATEESRRRLDATIGGGGPEIRLESLNGAIRVVGK